MAKKRKARSARSGLYVSPEEAKRNPSETILETPSPVTSEWLNDVQARLRTLVRDVGLMRRKVSRKR